MMKEPRRFQGTPTTRDPLASRILIRDTFGNM
jgi:hypothetical protein